MTRAQREWAIIGALRDLGSSREAVLTELCSLEFAAEVSHATYSPSRYAAICRFGNDGMYMDRLLGPGIDLVEGEYEAPIHGDESKMDSAESGQLRRERVAVTIAAVLDDPNASHDDPWPLVVAHPNAGPRSWGTLERAAAVARRSPYLPPMKAESHAECLAGYLRAASELIAAIHEGGASEKFDLNSTTVPLVTTVTEAVEWLRERSGIGSMWFRYSWYEEVTNGDITSQKLRDAAAAGKVRSRKLNGRDNEYHLGDVIRTWPRCGATLISHATEFRQFGG